MGVPARAFGSPVSRVPAHKTLTPSGNQKADVLAQVHTLTTDPSVDIDLVHRKSDHCCTQVGWHIAKDAGLPLKYSDTLVCLGGSVG